MDEHSVSVFIYDITRGLARSMSGPLLGKQLDGVWHTGIVVYGQEFYFGGMGIESCPPGGTIMGEPGQKQVLGQTQVPLEMFMEYLQELGNSTFRAECYHLMDHNCNTFSNEVAMFLTGNPIPSYITSLPQEVLNTPLGAMLRPFLDAMTVNPSGGTPVVQPVPLSHNSSSGGATAAENTPKDGATSQSASSANKEGATSNRPIHEPVQFTDRDKVGGVCGQVIQTLAARLDPGDKQTLQDLQDFVTSDQNWGLSRSHLKLVDTILKDPDCSAEQKAAVALLFQESLCHDDVVAMVMHDPGVSYLCMLQLFEQQKEIVQETLAKGLCNCAAHKDGLGWLLESRDVGGRSARNSDIVMSVCRHSLLHQNPNLQNTGAALANNLTRVKVSDELAVDLGCAMVELLQKDIQETAAKHLVIALCQCIDSNSEVAAIAVVSGINSDSLASRHPNLKELCTGQLETCLQKYTS